MLSLHCIFLPRPFVRQPRRVKPPKRFDPDFEASRPQLESAKCKAARSSQGRHGTKVRADAANPLPPFTRSQRSAALGARSLGLALELWICDGAMSCAHRLERGASNPPKGRPQTTWNAWLAGLTEAPGLLAAAVVHRAAPETRPLLDAANASSDGRCCAAAGHPARLARPAVSFGAADPAVRDRD